LGPFIYFQDRINGALCLVHRKDVKRRKSYRYLLAEAGEAIGEVKGERRKARVQNMSIGGIALLTDHALNVGTILHVLLQGGAAGMGQKVRLRVAHAETQADGMWLIGCAILDP
jgi:hypothetical protein